MSRNPSAETPAARRSHLPMTVALLTGVLASAFEAYGALTAMPVAARELGNLDLYAWTATIYIIAQVLAIVVSGRATDRWGAVRPLGVGVGIFVIGLVIGALAPTMPVLLVGRFIQGIGSGAMNLTLMVVIAHGYTGKLRADMMGWLSFCWVLPSFLGPPIAAWVTERFSWHWVFWGVIPIMVLASLLGARPLFALDRDHQPDPAERNPIKISWAILTAAGAAVIQAGGHWLKGDTIALGLAISAVGLAILIVAVPKLMPDGFVGLKPGIPSALAVRVLGAGSFYATENFLTLFLTLRYELSLTTAGLFLTLGSIGWAVGSFLQAQPWVKLSRDRLIQLGAVLMVVPLALMAVAGWQHWSLVVVALCFIVAGAGVGLIVAVVSLLNMQLSAPSALGRNTSSLQVGDSIGNAIFTGLAGTVFALLGSTGDLGLTFGVLFGIEALVAGCAVLVSRRIGHVANEVTPS